jgi:hypothetical protein
MGTPELVILLIVLCVLGGILTLGLRATRRR